MANDDKFYYIDAVTISVAKKILKFYFEDDFVRAEKNNKERTYDVYLIKPTDDEALQQLQSDIQYWVDYWGAGYKFYWSANEEVNG